MFGHARRRPRRRGFTLMEVLLVMLILVMLGGTASMFFLKIQKNAEQDATKHQIDILKEALDLYRMDVGMYPSDQQGLEALRTPAADLPNATKWRGPYMKDEIPPDPWQNPYKYVKVSEDTVQIVSFGPDRTEGTGDDVAK